jgi:hypothetical protein
VAGVDPKVRREGRTGTIVIVLAGLLVSVVGAGWTLAIDVASYFIPAGLLLSIRLPSRPSPPEGNTLWRELLHGWAPSGSGPGSGSWCATAVW